MTLANRPGGLAATLDKAFYSPREVAALASLSSSTILNYIRDGQLAAVKLSERTYRIPRKAVIRLLAPDEAAEPVVVTDPDHDPGDAL